MNLVEWHFFHSELSIQVIQEMLNKESSVSLLVCVTPEMQPLVVMAAGRPRDTVKGRWEGMVFASLNLLSVDGLET